jgi:hypothetical protein
MSEEKENVIAYTEAEAAEKLRMKSERALAEYRRRHLRIGTHYGKIGRTVIYTPRHLQNIAEMDSKAA